MLFTLYLGILGIALFVLLKKWKHYKYNYPPGLPEWPLVGSVPYMQFKHLHVGIKELAKTYGPVFRAKLGPKPVLFVTGADNVMAALRKEEFQGRPDEVGIRERSPDKTHKSLGIFFSDGTHWSDIRRFTIRQLRSFGASQLEQFITKEINTLNDSIKDGSVIEMTGLFSLSAVNVIWLIIANKTFQPDDERIRIFISENKSTFRSGSLAGSLADVHPLLRFFDKQHKKRTVHTQNTHRIIRDLIEEHKEILDPNHPFDLIDNYLVEMKNNKGPSFSENDLITVCFDLFSAGAEPIAGALDFVLLYLLLYPEVQKKMQEELDRVLAKARKPTLEDKNRLPYTTAVLNEVARINPTTPVIVPHRCTKDTYFNDFYVEKDTKILMDHWSMGYDLKYWDNPEDFRPERFLDGEGQLKKTAVLHPFGIGSRICAGESVSRNIMFLFITTFFEKYTLSLPEGEPRPSTEALPGFTAGPQPFRALIRSRY